MLNLFQHLIKSIYYETLKRVQGDKKMNCDTVSMQQMVTLYSPSPFRERVRVRGPERQRFLTRH